MLYNIGKGIMIVIAIIIIILAFTTLPLVLFSLEKIFEDIIGV